MKKIIGIIISLIFFLAGSFFVVSGIFLKSKMNNTTEKFDAFSTTANDKGKFVSGEASECCPVQQDSTTNFYISTYYHNNGEKDERAGAIVGFIVPKSKSPKFEESCYMEDTTAEFKGIILKSSDNIRAQIEGFMTQYYTQYASAFWGEKATEKEIENAISESMEVVPDYYVFVLSENMCNISLIIGGILVGISLIISIINLSKGRIKTRYVLLALLILILVGLGVLAYLFRDKIKTITSVEQKEEGLYTVEYADDYKSDEFIKAGIGSPAELMEWISKNALGGIPLTYDINSFGCSAFSAQTTDGKHLMGRNFDYLDTDGLLIHTSPENGHSSYAMADLSFLGVGEEYGVPADSLIGRIAILASPYICMDGINDAGVGVSILQLNDIGETHQDNGKNNLFISSAIRVILDKCDNVDDAVKFLENVDIHSSLNCTYHLFITDKTGKSVVVEWIDNKMKVIDDDACTNFVLSKGKYYGKGELDDRYSKLKKALKKSKGKLSEEEAMKLLSTVADRKDLSTQWSCVYNLDDFTVDICTDGNYD